MDDVDLRALPGEVVGLIGSNGAGKSTLLNAIGGFVPAAGRVELLGQDVSRFKAYRRARLGLGRSFQAATLFPELSVREVVELALEARAADLVLGHAALPAPLHPARARSGRPRPPS